MVQNSNNPPKKPTKAFCSGNNIQVNEMVKNQLDIILNILTSKFSPEAVIGDGSLGKGEITAIKMNNGKIKIISDY